MLNIDKISIVYLGFNNILKHKRGVENVILFQTRYIENASKYYIFFDTEEDYFMYLDIKCIGIKHDKKRFNNLNKIINKISKTSRRIIIHSHNYLMSFFLYRKTDIFTVHDGLYYLSRYRYNNIKLFIFKFIEKLVYIKSDKVHFISKYSIKKSLYDERKNKHVLIYNTTPLELLMNRYENENYIEDSHIYKNNKINIFTVRSIEDRARIDILIELAKRNRESMNIYIAGKGPLLSHYKKIINDYNLNNIKLLGFLTDEELIYHYKACDICILLAEFGEGFGLPIIEAYLCNKKVIGSNRCAIPEIIIDESYLFDNNLESIEKKIFEVYYINEVNYKNYYMERFSMSAIGKEYKKLYKTIIYDS